MKYLPTLLLALLLSGYSWAEPSSADDAYQQPYPHSSGADLLAYCDNTGEVISQLRCDYYVQGVADLATIPQQGQPLACIPRGQNRTQLMQVAVNYLKTVKPETREAQSAASLILQGFRATFPCSVADAAEASKTGEPAPLSKETAEAIYKAMLEANQKAGGMGTD
jgi:Rap1a immunity proteins